MKTVKLSLPPGAEYIIRQTPGSAGKWGDYRFHINTELDACDYWVVINNLEYPEHCRCAPGQTLFLSYEPPTIKLYNPAFLAQFATVISNQPHIRHPGLVRQHTGNYWYAGLTHPENPSEQVQVNMNYDDFRDISSFRKQKLCSVISSFKKGTRGHQLRRRFTDAVREHFGERVDIFGHGIRDIDDKWDAIAPYKYHIAIENSIFPHYWTEKLADTFLAGAYPIYGGCENIHDYFPPESLTRIDYRDITSSLDTIGRILDSDTWEKAEAAIMAAREQVLDRYNLFPMICDFLSAIPENKTDEVLELRPKADFRMSPRFYLERKWWKARRSLGWM